MVITMAIPQLEPITFRRYDVVKTFKQFEGNVKDYSKAFSDITEIEGYVDNFIKKTSRTCKTASN